MKTRMMKWLSAILAALMLMSAPCACLAEQPDGPEATAEAAPEATEAPEEGAETVDGEEADASPEEDETHEGAPAPEDAPAPKLDIPVTADGEQPVEVEVATDQPSDADLVPEAYSAEDMGLFDESGEPLEFVDPGEVNLAGAGLTIEFLDDEPFQPGYVFVAANTPVFADATTSARLGAFTEAAVTYAAKRASGRLEIVFDTPDARESGASLPRGYVALGDARTLDDNELTLLELYFLQDSQTRSTGGAAIPCIVAFNPATGEEAEPATLEIPAGAVGLGVAAHSQKDIQSFVDSHPAYLYQENLFRTPSSKYPYTYGKLSKVNLQSALNLVNQMRYIAGLDASVSLLDSQENAMAATALVNALNNELSHYPARPAVLADSQYNTIVSLANQGAKSANLAYTYYNACTTNSILLYMGDSDASNIANVGHRRWILNPKLKRTAFGAHGSFTATYVLDASGSGGQTKIAWPGQEMPLQYFSVNDAWSLSFGREVKAANIQVTLMRLSDGKTWHFASTGSDGYFSVGQSGMGAAGCVIFRPKGLGSLSDGDTFQVLIQDAAKNESVAYQVHFFSVSLNKAKPLASPSLTTAERTDAGARLAWNSVSGASGYYVCRSDAYNDLCVVADVSGTSYTDTAISPEFDYTYRVYAHSASVTSATSSGSEAKLTAVAAGGAGLLSSISYPTSHAASAGESFQLEVSCSPASARNYIRFRSSDPSVAEVDEVTGEITARKGGSATITAYAGSVQANCALTVNEVPITDLVSLNFGDYDAFYAGEYYYGSLLYHPANATNNATYTSSDTSVATIDASGWLKAVAPGSVTITATAPNGTKAVAELEIRSRSHPLTLTLKKGQSFTPQASTSGISFKSSDADVASVSNSGVITATGSGTALITGTIGKTTSVVCQVGVASPYLPALLTLDRGDVYKPTGNVSGLRFKSSNTKAATVNSSTGEITGVLEGDAVITATDSSGSTVARCEVKVVEPPVTHLSYVPEYVLKPGQKVEWDIISIPFSMKKIKFVSWNTDVATVNAATGEITAVKEGEATIAALIESYPEYVTCKVTVSASAASRTAERKDDLTGGQYVTATGVALNYSGTVDLPLGKTLQLEATILPEGASTSVLTWKSYNGRVAKIDKYGVVTPVAAGTVVVSARIAEGAETKLTVNVIDASSPSGVTLNRTGSITLNLGDTLALAAKVTPEQAKTTLTWKTTNAKVATVSSSGVIVTVGEGSATISVSTANGKTASLSVTVADLNKITALKLDKTGTVTVNLGSTLTLTAIPTPAGAKPKLTWTSSSAKVATVSASGVVTPVAEGTATITVASANGKKAKVKVKVNDPYKPLGISLANGKNATLELGKTLQLRATLNPTTARTTLTWTSSSAKIATVSSKGVVTPLKEGSVTIKVTTGNKKSASIKIKIVDPNKVTGIKLSQGKKGNLAVGKTLQLTAVITPASARTTLTWKSSNAAVASVSANGLVTGLKAGKATITVTAPSGKKATYTVTVK